MVLYYFHKLRSTKRDTSDTVSQPLLRQPFITRSLCSYMSEPLDEELSDRPILRGIRATRILWIIGLLALTLRLILLPVGHPWDLTIDYNVFIDLAHNHSPYDTLAYLTHIARASEWDTTYEYYAYPPVPIYLYYPLAKLFFLLHPHATYFIAVPGSSAVPVLPLDFYFFFKLPIWIADFLIATLLARMSGTIRGFRDYLLNPYVLIISGAWTFDAIMVLGLVAGVYYIQRGKYVKAGVALAFGTMVKFFPALIVPTVVIFLIKKKRPLHEIFVFLLAYGVACLLFLGPFLRGFLAVLSFHSSRLGGGMNWQTPLSEGSMFFPHVAVGPILAAIGYFGTPMLIIVLLLAYWYAFVTSMSFNRMIVVTLLAFFVGSKLVNEQYALIIFPFAFLEAYRTKGAWRWFHLLLWVIPVAFTFFRVPIDHFFWLLYRTVFGERAAIISVTGITGFEAAFVPWKHALVKVLCIVILGTGFFLLSLIAMLWPSRAPRRIPRGTRRSSSLAYQPDEQRIYFTPERVATPEEAIKRTQVGV